MGATEVLVKVNTALITGLKIRFGYTMGSGNSKANAFSAVYSAQIQTEQAWGTNFAEVSSISKAGNQHSMSYAKDSYLIDKVS